MTEKGEGDENRAQSRGGGWRLGYVSDESRKVVVALGGCKLSRT